MTGEYRKSFNDAYAFGRIAESQIGRYLIQVAGYDSLLPAYEIEIPSGKGPRLLTKLEELVAPDILALKYKKKFLVKWVEAKHKTRFTWRWTKGTWQTGIDLRHYLDYIKVQQLTKIEVLILFLHICATPSKSDLERGCPPICPTGLYGCPLSYLMEHEDHRDSYGRSGREYPMVYWNESDLEKLASVEQVQTLPQPLWKGVAV